MGCNGRVNDTAYETDHDLGRGKRRKKRTPFYDSDDQEGDDESEDDGENSQLSSTSKLPKKRGKGTTQKTSNVKQRIKAVPHPPPIRNNTVKQVIKTIPESKSKIQTKNDKPLTAANANLRPSSTSRTNSFKISISKTQSRSTLPGFIGLSSNPKESPHKLKNQRIDILTNLRNTYHKKVADEEEAQKIKMQRLKELKAASKNTLICTNDKDQSMGSRIAAETFQAKSSDNEEAQLSEMRKLKEPKAASDVVAGSSRDHEGL